MFKFITNCFALKEEELPLYSKSDMIFEEPKKIVIEEFDNKKMINELLDYTYCKYETLLCICENRDLDMIKWLHKNGVIFPELSINCAIAYGKLDVLNFLYEKGYSYKDIGINFHIENAMKQAIEGNQQKVVEYLKTLKQ